MAGHRLGALEGGGGVPPPPSVHRWGYPNKSDSKHAALCRAVLAGGSSPAGHRLGPTVSGSGGCGGLPRGPAARGRAAPVPWHPLSRAHPAALWSSRTGRSPWIPRRPATSLCCESPPWRPSPRRTSTWRTSWRRSRAIAREEGGSPPPPPKTKGTIVGKNEIYNREDLIGPLLVHTLLGPRPPPPPAMHRKGRDLRGGSRGG